MPFLLLTDMILKGLNIKTIDSQIMQVTNNMRIKYTSATAGEYRKQKIRRIRT